MSRRSRPRRSLFSSLVRFSRPVDRALEWKRSRCLRMETLEPRHLLAVDILFDAGTGFVTVLDGAIAQDNHVTLSVGNFDPDGGQGAAAQDGLLITSASGFDNLATGIFAVSATEAFVPQNFDFDAGVGVNLQDVLTTTVIVDLQGGTDWLEFGDDLDTLPVVTNFEVRGGDSGTHSDRLLLNSTAGVAESLVVDEQQNGSIQVTGFANLQVDVWGMETVQLIGAESNDSLQVIASTKNSDLVVRSSATAFADEVLLEQGRRVVFSEMDDFMLSLNSTANSRTTRFALAELDGALSYTYEAGLGDTIVIEGSAEVDDVVVSQQPGQNLQIASNIIQLLELSGVNETNQIVVNGYGGNDTLTVDVTGVDLFAPAILFDGGSGSDTLTVQGDASVDVESVVYTPGLQVDEGTLLYTSAASAMRIDFDNLEPVVDLVVAAQLVVNGTNASNDITYTAGSMVDRGLVSTDGFETVEFANKAALTINALAGDDTVVINNPEVPTGLTTLTVNGGSGHDDIRLEALPDASATTYAVTVVSGGIGDDNIDGSTIVAGTPLVIDGNSGNDTLSGGLGNDTIQGGDGDDVVIDSHGSDNISGGLGDDQYVVRGDSSENNLQVYQLAPSLAAGDFYQLEVVRLGLLYVKNVGKTLATAPADGPNRPDFERIVVEGLAGSDMITFTQADEYSDLDMTNGVASQTIAATVDGGAGGFDWLRIPDQGDGDLIVQRVAADPRDGSFEVAANRTIEYIGIEQPLVDISNPITGGTGADGAGRLVVFKHDPFELNDSLPTATFLGAGPTVNVDPTIDPAGFLGFAGDNDFYQFVAQETGTLDLQVYFEPIGTLANGRAGLPGDGELVATMYDSDGLPVSIGTASDLFDPAGNKVGERVTVPVVRNQTYYLRVEGEMVGGVSAANVYNFTGIVTAAPIPELVDLQAASDSGRHDGDNITKIETPTFDIILDDDRIDEFMNLDLNPDTVDDDAATLNDAGGAPIDYGVEVFNNGVSIGFAFYTGAGNTWQFTATAGDLNEGDFNHISAAVWVRDAADPAQIGRHLLSDSLQVTLDTVTPPGSFGLPTVVNGEDGLAASSDTGVTTDPTTYADRVTSDTTPTFWGIAEADSIVRVFLDVNNNSVIDLGVDVLLGQDVATPEDGNAAYPNGYWEVTSNLDLNEIVGLPKDGVRRILMTAEDVAGNPMPMNDQIADGLDRLLIFLDTQGPQVYDPAGAVPAIFIPDAPEFDLFVPKPEQDGFTPLVNQLSINLRDLPLRSNLDLNFLYDALQQEVAEALGHYTLVGDHVGTIAIVDVDVVNAPAVNGQQATAVVTLTFDQPLPDDRYTLTLKDSLVDPANNALDGESNASGPVALPEFPSGDGVPGGDFVARFTIDSRPEIGSYIPTTISVDINGNFEWDPANGPIGNDYTNVDLTFTMTRQDAGGTIPGGFGVHDLVFAGQFIAAGAIAPDRPFDQLAVFGALGGDNYRWLVDVNSDGVVNAADGDYYTLQPRFVNGFDTAGAIPIAGNFDNDATNGDEIGLYHAGRWALDTNRNFVIDAGDQFLLGNLLGNPIVGDFNNDGQDDLAVHHANDHQFRFDLDRDGFTDDTIEWGFPGAIEIPVAADLNQDGIDDIGLWVPRNSTQPDRPEAEWFFLVSHDTFPQGQFNVDNLDHAFSIVPFGTDLTAHFGDELARPIVGNFDPPVALQSPTDPGGTPVVVLAGDFDGSGTVDAGDYAVWKASFGQTGPGLAADANGDQVVDAADYSAWRNNLGATSPLAGGSLLLASEEDASPARAEPAPPTAPAEPTAPASGFVGLPSGVGVGESSSGSTETPGVSTQAVDAAFSDAGDALLLLAGWNLTDDDAPLDLDDLFDLGDDEEEAEEELLVTL